MEVHPAALADKRIDRLTRDWVKSEEGNSAVIVPAVSLVIRSARGRCCAALDHLSGASPGRPVPVEPMKKFRPSANFTVLPFADEVPFLAR